MTKSRLWSIAGWTLGIVAILIAAIILYIITFLPKVRLMDVKVSMTSDQMTKGRYLANHVMICIDCHSERDWQYYSGPLKPGTEGQGGEIFDDKMGLPGRFVSPNITPYAMKNWSDGEIFRAITQGVNKKGKPLFPIMPYPFYGTLDKEDIYAIIAYIRSIPEIKSDPEKSMAYFPVNIMLHLIPRETSFTQRPNPTDSLAVGKYLVTAGACIHCHTVSQKGEPDMSRAFAGGQVLPTPNGTIISANITPSKSTGIGNWEPDAFVARFKAFEPGKAVMQLTSSTGLNTVMPWTMYAGMETSDLRAIFHFLRNLTPIENRIVQKVRE